MQRLKGGGANLKFGRPDARVEDEVTRFLTKHDLDFLVVQEARDYANVLPTIPGYKYFTDKSKGGIRQDGFLVREELVVDRIAYSTRGDGWRTVFGAWHKPNPAHRLRIDGWLYVRAVHLMTPTHWRNGRLIAAAERKDDYIAHAKDLLRYFRPPCILNGRLAVGDWNESPVTSGKWSPRWIAAKRNAQRYWPKQKAGHGLIDWVMAKGVVITNIYKDVNFKEGSDHEWFVFTVTKKERLVSRSK